MSASDRSREAVRDWVGTSDLRLIALVMLAIYVGFSLFGLVLGLNVNGLVNTLQRITFLTAVYAMVVLALNLHWGYTGLFNIGVAGFMAVAVYTMAILTEAPSASPPGLGLPLPVGILGGLVAAGVFGAIIALPALRLRADYLAIVTVAFSEIIRLTLLSSTFRSFTVAGVELGTGGGRGIGLPTNPVRALYYVDPDDTTAGVTPLGDALFGAADAVGVTANTVVSWTYTLVLVGFVVLFYVLLVRVGNSPFGRVLKAIREDELVASSLGKDTARFKIKAFVVGCALMGLAGILWEGAKGFTNPTSTTFLPLQTFYVFVALIIGGAGSNTGSVLGGALFASLLFEGPTFVGRIIDQLLDLGRAPNDFAEAVGPLAGLDPMPLFTYAVGNIPTLRFVLVGVVLVYLMQRQPEGLLGHRKEVASPIDLSERGTATDGGERDE